MKTRPKLELEKILDILYKIKDDVFYFKEYGKDLISSYIKQEQDKNKYSEEDMIEFAKFMLLENHEYKSYTDIFNEWFEKFKNK